MSLSRKPLIRSNSHSDKFTMRNWPLFAFLIGLVLFFYVFYIYQAQSTTLTMANDEIRLLNSQLASTKNKLVDTMASLETADAAQKTMSTDLETAKKTKDECYTNLRAATLRLKNLDQDNTDNRDKLQAIQAELTAIKEQAETLQKNNTGLKNVVAAQEQLIQQLNQTVSLLKFETAQLRATTGNQAESDSAPVAAVAAAAGAENPQEKLVESTVSSSTTTAAVNSTSQAPKPVEGDEVKNENQVEEPKPEKEADGEEAV